MTRNRGTRGFSLIELMIVIAIMLIIATIALPRLHQAKMYSQEVAAIKAIETIHSVQILYQSHFGRFAASLAELGPPESGQPGPHAAALIDRRLASGESNGYKFAVAGGDAGYTISAVPVAYNSTGTRTFYADQTMEIHENNGPEPATAQSPLYHP
jgi:prepilin-type N-terminal cleavage/methylation domain-containing protein